MVNVDLHMHGPIGFQEYWLKVQGYQSKNILKEISDICFKKEIDICAITSQEMEIPTGSIHDRFYQLTKYAKSIPRSYKHDRLGEIALVVEKYGQKAIIVNSQSVVVFENKNGQQRRIDHLVVGSNQVPNNRSLEDTIKHCQDNGLIQIAEHAFLTEHFGIGRELLERYIKEIDAIEIHNAQLFLPEIFRLLPAFGSYNKSINKRARKFADFYKKPGVANSDAHKIENLGTAYTIMDFTPDLTSPDKLLESLKLGIKKLDPKNPNIKEGYIPLFDFIDWTTKFSKGVSERLKHDV